MDNIIFKGAKVSKLAITDDELAKINELAINTLTAEQLYTFKVAICNNEVDRDFEVFPLKSLEKMAGLFNGRTIIKNHQNNSDNQCARIYDTEVIKGKGMTKNDETYAQLIAHCYMIKTDSNKDLVAEIQGGIKKEVSVGCKLTQAVCSICGIDNRKAYCEHYGGQEYDGKQCYFKLLEPLDAYEVSFVAVPAQPKAGVTKSYTGEEQTYREDMGNTIEYKLKKDLINAELGIIKSFIFIQKERG